jgi:multicomponent Na+:H+ antiporter subunit G
LVLVAVALISMDVAVSVRALIGVLFLLLTTPVAAHLLARASYLAGYRADQSTVRDDLKTRLEQNSGP